MNDRDVLREHCESLGDRPLCRDVDAARVGAYRGYGELMRAWLRLADDRAELSIAGHSVNGEPIVNLSSGPSDAPRTSVILAGLHPIEWIAVETGQRLLEALVSDPPEGRRIVVFPMINVDGFRRVEDEVRRGRRRWRRGNSHGVDLNRNWPTFFQERRRQWSLTGLRGGGPSALSEPETRAVTETLDRIEQGSAIDVALSLHSFGRMILVPYGGTWRRPPQRETLRRAARSIQEELARRGAPGYRVRQVSRWLPGLFARGIEIDHLHERHDATAILVECSGGGLRLRDPGSWLHPFRWYNPPEVELIAGRLADSLVPFVRGDLV